MQWTMDRRLELAGLVVARLWTPKGESVWRWEDVWLGGAMVLAAAQGGGGGGWEREEGAPTVDGDLTMVAGVVEGRGRAGGSAFSCKLKSKMSSASGRMAAPTSSVMLGYLAWAAEAFAR